MRANFLSTMVAGICVLALWAQPAAAQTPVQSLTIDNGNSTLAGRDSWLQLIVTGKTTTGQARDLTGQATYSASPVDVVKIDAGFVTPLKEGQATIQVKGPNNLTTSTTVKVTHLTQDLPINFPNQIVPIFTKFGCNAGGCHGKSGGQNGFQLSLLGFEPTEDYEFLVKENRGRRLFPAAPDHSLLLTKATGTIAHGGGKKLELDSPFYSLMRRWVAQGTPYGQAGDPEIKRIQVIPGNRVLERNSKQQLAVIAHLSDGTTVDVTRMTQFETNDKELAEVSQTGLVSVYNRPGSVAIMTRFQIHVDVFQALIPLGENVGKLPAPRNFIDELVFKRWQQLGLPPSNVADDGAFLRRVTFDIAGRLPTPEETTQFLADKSNDRHDKAVDRLLASPEYGFYFANKWSAVLRNRRKSDKEDPRPTFAFHGWIKDSLDKNKPFDHFVRDILTASGQDKANPAVIWYRDVDEVGEQVEDVSQLFLGQRIMCARCHHHPFEKWSQQDYYGLAAFFTRLEIKDLPAPKKTKDMKEAPPKPPFEVNHKPGAAQAQNPRSKAMVKPTGLGAAELAIAPTEDPRPKLVDWLTGPQNPYFARTLVNRYWKHFFSRGLVEPEDDMRVTNPPSNPELLDALAKHFVASKYDLKALVRAICTSHVYRLSSDANKFNADDRQNFSRFLPRRLPAEVLCDAIDDFTQSRTTFKGVPAGTRAIQLPDNQFDSYFLSVFGRPDSASACECERSSDSSLAQSLHLLNSVDVQTKIAKGRTATLVKDKRSHQEKIRDIYLLAFSRPPSAEELAVTSAYLERRSASLQNAYEDLFWTLINTKEFLFNH